MSVEAFRATMIDCGIVPPTVIEPGKLHRFSGNGKPGDDAAWCKLFEDGTGGVFGDWRTGVSQVWQAKREHSPAQREAFRRRCEEASKERAAEEKRRHDQARERALAGWSAADPAADNNPYLARKAVRPTETLREIHAQRLAQILGYTPKSRGEPLTGRVLVVPVKVDDSLATLELIDGDGRKSAIYGGRKAGGYWATERLPDGNGLTLQIGEGVVTVLSPREATGAPGVAVLSSSNLPAVAKAMRERYPAAKLVILADLVKATGEPDPHAIEAARLVGGRLAVPDFGPDRDPDMTDFNDMAATCGLEAVRRAIASAIEPRKPDRETAPTGDSAGTGEVAEMNAERARLAVLSPLAYDRERVQAAKNLGVRLATLDDEVAACRGSEEADNDSAVEELSPWTEQVSGDVLNEIRDDFGRHVFATAESLDAVSLWTLGTYCYDAFGIWSKLFFCSPERRCGKTVALEVLEANVSRALMASSISSSAIFRAVHAWKPCLIVDEADTFGKENEELTGIINAGHRKRSAVVIRNVKVGDEHIPKKFSVWSPMAIAAIGRLRDTIMDRSIVVQMQRKAPGERIDRAPADLFERNQQRRRRCLRWAEDHLPALKQTRVDVPHCGNDRARDNWEPLFAIAQVIGGDWPRRAQAALAKLSTEEEEESIGPMLLSDICEILEAKSGTKIFSQDLVDSLVAMEDRPWCEWRRGKPMTQNSLAKLLHPYKIHACTVRLGAMTRKGYKTQIFENAFQRYLSPSPSVEPPKQTVTTSHPNNGAGSGEMQTVTNSTSVTDVISREPNNGAGCDVVTVQKGGYVEVKI